MNLSISKEESSGFQIKEQQIEEFLTRGVTSVYPSANALGDALRSGKQLTAYMGIDPTAADLHIGHASQLYKLKRLHKMGHKIILLIGDFTAMIGDPTDKSAARTRLSREQVLQNALLYKQQASKILDFDDPSNPIEIKYNSEWLSKLDAEEILNLSSMMSVQQMSQRDMFQKRFEEQKPVWIHEFLYPLFQGWDSVEMDVDIEIGGSDQIFNMLVGTEFVKRKLGKQKYVVAGELLVDPSGKKIGKTEGNMITLNDSPENMYHKIMMWSDAIVPHAYELCSQVSINQLNELINTKAFESDGIKAKMNLARVLVSELHSESAANNAENQYKSLASGGLPLNDIQKCTFLGKITIIEVLVSTKLSSSNSEARRLIANRGVRINNKTIENINYIFTPQIESYVVQVGKKKAENFRMIYIIE